MTERTNETILLDGQNFTGMTFQDCEFVYAGGELPELRDNQFTGCMFHFEDAAARTLTLMRWLAEADGGRELVMDAEGLTERPVMTTDDLQDLFNR
jgi:hypothetical protein